MKCVKTVFTGLSIALLAACGGGGGSSGGTTVPAAVPNTADNYSPNANFTSLPAFSPISGAVAITANSPSTSNTYVTVPKRGEVFVAVGPADANAVLSYIISSTLPAGLPAFDSSKTVIGAVQATTNAAVTLTGPLDVSFAAATNGNYSVYHLAYISSSGGWIYDAGTLTSSNAYELSVARGATLTPGVTYTIVLYAG